MKKSGRTAKSALSVVQKIAEQEHMLAKSELFDAMQKMREAENARMSLDQRLREHHRMLSDNWRSQASDALRTSLNSLPYGSWLQSEIESAQQHENLVAMQLDASKEQETKLRATARLMQELADRRRQEAMQAMMKESYKEVDEMILLARRHDIAND
ncbi:MAG: hypothetical protein QM776_13480 [Rhodocyclaceae bacterium]